MKSPQLFDALNTMVPSISLYLHCFPKRKQKRPRFCDFLTSWRRGFNHNYRRHSMVHLSLICVANQMLQSVFHYDRWLLRNCW
jgi:hypothetical protein